MIVQRKYFNQITKLWMAVRRIEVQYRHYLKNIRFGVHDQSLDHMNINILTVFGHNDGNNTIIDLNKILNKQLQTYLHYVSELQSIEHDKVFVLPSSWEVIVSQIRIESLGDKIGRFTLIMDNDYIINKQFNSKNACLFVKLPMCVIASRIIKTEYPCRVSIIYVKIMWRSFELIMENYNSFKDYGQILLNST